ncbi:MAG TPA: hypothetical protein VFM96_03785 [Gaiellaceae bacterium]|nr:hypothetical protein [Gaiellaceae bacterium]
MKLKVLLLAVFAAGLSASLAFADDGKHKDKGPTCTPVHLEGTVAPQSLTMTVTKGSDGAPVAGSSVTLAIGTTGQTVRVNVEACSSGGTFTVKHLELQPMKPKPAGTTTGDDDHGDKHKGGTTTTATTTTSPTTTATTP